MTSQSFYAGTGNNSKGCIIPVNGTICVEGSGDQVCCKALYYCLWNDDETIKCQARRATTPACEAYAPPSCGSTCA